MQVRPSVLEPHIPDIAEIISTQLGEGYSSEMEIRRAIRYGSDRFISVAFPDLDSDPPCEVVHSPPPSAAEGTGADSLPDNVHTVPAAVAMGCVFDSPSLASHVNFPPNDYPPSLAQVSPVGLLRCLSIHEDATGRNILSTTVGHTLSVLEDEGCQVQCALAWRSDEGVQFYSMFKQHDFSLRREFNDYWMEESRREGYRCPECGSPPCTCSALLFVRVGKTGIGF